MQIKNESEDPSGILVVDKEKGMTSHDVVALVRRRFSIKKAGHAGTLDPNATGVLVLLIGAATKRSDEFLNKDKEYVAVMKLGERTDTGDCDGKVLAEREVNVTREDILSLMEKFKGESEQMPPMFSAKRYKGKKLYELARKGKEVEREPRKIVISELEAVKIDLPLVTFRVVCGKGTYVRQLAEDMGEALGCGAHLVELRRTRSGEYDLSKAFSVGDLSKMTRESLSESISRI